MCGIVGICNLRGEPYADVSDLGRMMALIRHRGPDETGVYLDDWIGLGNARLSIIDLERGGQPIHNEDETLWMVYNGEVFNYLELRQELLERGHRFYTTSDTEVILHLYEQLGPRCVERLNGQFAFAIWNRHTRELFLARDRVGIRPLHYAVHGGNLLFASEIKSLFAVPGVRRALDPVSLDQIFTFWSVLPGRTPFQDVHELPPGHWLTASRRGVQVERYWEIPVYARPEQLQDPLESLCERTLDLLADAVRLRLRSDVPVGGYLSGGLDSSGIASLVTHRFNSELNTFGLRFDQTAFDEGIYQQAVASFLGVSHREVRVTAQEIGDHLARTLWHVETPLLRMAPVPLYLLSAAVRESGFKVVLTGEGADEIFGGYGIFQEAKVRQYWARRPEVAARAALFRQLHGHVFQDSRAKPFLGTFFARGLDRLDDPLSSHLIRWENTSRIKTFLSSELKAAIGTNDPCEPLRRLLPGRYPELDVVGKAQCIEMLAFLSSYLLSSQGDRVAMAHGVELRMPFLDHRMIDWAARIPSRWKILGLNEKHILKRMFRSILPPEIVARRKQPYRAPVVDSLLSPAGRRLILDVLEPGVVRRAGLFDDAKVSRLVDKVQAGGPVGEVDGMALAGILSSQIIYRQFVEDFPERSCLDFRPDLVVDRRTGWNPNSGRGTDRRRQAGPSHPAGPAAAGRVIGRRSL